MEIPEAKLIKSEILLRDMDLTEDVKMTRKSLVRWIALSLGLISPKESRQSILSLLEAILFYHVKEKREPNYNDIQDYLRSHSIDLNEKTTRYHLTQLKKSKVLENSRGTYKIAGFDGSNPADSLERLYKSRCNTAFSNIKDAFSALEKLHTE